MKRVSLVSSATLLASAVVMASFTTVAPSFTTLNNWATGNPRGVTAGDFNGDGHLDFASANFSTNGLTILDGDGVGGFAQVDTVTSHISIPRGAFGIAAGRLAHRSWSGHQDDQIVVSSADSNMLSIVAWDNASDEFDIVDSVPSPADPREVTIADFNRDGNNDIAVAFYGCGCMEVWLGQGNLTFGAHLRVGLIGYGAHGIATADFNKDGIPDLVVTNAVTNQAFLLYGDGTGAFPNWQSFAVNGKSPRNVAVGDFNGDGVPDFATVNTDSNSITVGFVAPVPPGSKSAGLSSSRTLTVGTMLNSPRDIAAVDVNGDGKLDLVVPNAGSGKVVVLSGDGLGHFGSAEGIRTDAFAAQSGARAVAFGDFDEDGRVDLFIGNQTAGTQSILTNTTAFTGRP